MSEYQFVVIYIQRDDQNLSPAHVRGYEDLKEASQLPNGVVTVEAENYDAALVSALYDANQFGSVRSIHFWRGPHMTCRKYEGGKLV